MVTALVTGAGGFIGGHLVNKLTHSGYEVRAVDMKPLDDWYQVSPHTENRMLDLRDPATCRIACRGMHGVFDLAADMGGIGFITSHKWDCSRSVLSSVHMLQAAFDQDVSRFFFSSSACVYPIYRQRRADSSALQESDAYPADCEDGYGWQKLYSERLCAAATEDLGLETRIARFHNIYGPYGTYDGGREKAPAAICRKVIEAKLSRRPRIEIWGDGEQTRSFCYVDDCVDGTIRIMNSDYTEPLNLGSSELVTINELVSIVEEIADIKLERVYKLDAPQGVRGRNSDNTLIKEVLNWEPSIDLRTGLEQTYEWIWNEMVRYA